MKPTGGVMSKWIVPLNLIAAAAVLATTRIVHLSDTEDAIQYVLFVTDGPVERLFHPNHLFFNAIGWMWYRVWQFFGFHGSALVPMQWLNICAGIASLGAIVQIARKLHFSIAASLWAMWTVLACFGFWAYAVSPDTYILPLSLGLVAISGLLTIATGGSSLGKQIATGLVIGLSILIHQQYILLLPATVVSIALGAHRGMNRRKTTLAVIAALGLPVLLVVVAHSVVGYFVADASTFGELTNWAKGRARGGLWTPWSSKSPVKAIVGLGRAIIGGHFLFGYAGVQQQFAQRFPMKFLVEEQFLAEGLPISIRHACSFGLLLLATISVAYVIAMIFSRRRLGKLNETQRDGLVVLVTFGIAVAAFTTIWEPANPEFWIPALPIAVLVIASITQKARGRAPVTFLFLATISLLATNYLGSLRPLADPTTDYWYTVNQPIIEIATPRDIVLSGGGFINNLYLRLYTPATVIRPIEYSRDSILSLIAEGSGEKVLISSWFFEPPPQVRLEERHRKQLADQLQRIERDFSASRNSFHVIHHGEHQVVWEINGDSLKTYLAAN